MTINFISSKDSNEILIMHTKNDNIEIMMGDETDDIIKELFESILQRYQEGSEEKMRGSGFIFYSNDLLHYQFYKTNLKSVRSYTDSPKRLKIKKATINPENNDDNCFQYAAIAALNHKQIKSHPERTSNLKPFIIGIYKPFL